MGDTLGDLIPSWRRHLRAANFSPKTITSYIAGAEQLVRFLEGRNLPSEVGAIRQQDVEGFIEDILERYRPATAATRYRDLQQLFRWLVDEGEISISPMARMRPPRQEQHPVPIIPKDDLVKLLRTTSGRSFEDRRDQAVVRVLINTGARLAEVEGLKLNDVDLEGDELWVMGKGRRARVLPIGPKTVKALDRYLRARLRHKDRDLPWLLAWSEGSAHRVRYRSDAQEAFARGGHRPSSPAPIQAFVCPPMAVERRR